MIGRWLKALPPTWGALIIIGAAAAAGASVTGIVATSRALPQQNAETLAEHIMLPAHPAMEERADSIDAAVASLANDVSTVGDSLDAFILRYERDRAIELCFRIEERTPAVDWEQCLVDEARAGVLRNFGVSGVQ